MSETHSFDSQPSSELELSLDLEDLNLDLPDSEDSDLNQLFASLNLSEEPVMTVETQLNEELDENLEDFTHYLSLNPQETPQASSETNWFELACKLKNQNQALIETVINLEQALAHTQQESQQHQRQLREKESSQQDHQQNELLKEENLQLQLEVENLTQEVNHLREKITQFIQESAKVQEASKEKDEQLTSAERHIRELYSRLQRQQRQTLQYKAALEQHLGESLENTLENESELLPQTVSIQPWSETKIASVKPNKSEKGVEPSIARSPSFRVNLSKVAPQYHSPAKSKVSSPHEVIDLPAFLRTRTP